MCRHSVPLELSSSPPAPGDRARGGAMAHQWLPQHCDGQGQAHPKATPGERSLCCPRFRTPRLLCSVGALSERAGTPAGEHPGRSNGRLPVPGSPGALRRSAGGSWCSPRARPRQRTPELPFARPLCGWFGSALDVGAARLFQLRSCTKLSVTALLAAKPLSPSSTLRLSKQEAVISFKGDSISAQ